MTAQNENLSRALLGTCAQIYLYSKYPERSPKQLAKKIQNLGSLVHAFIKLGRQEEIAQLLGPLSFSMLRSLVPTDLELSQYLGTLSIPEPEKEPSTLLELISGFDNIIVLLGRKASGKGTIGQILKDDYGFPNIATSDWLKAIAVAEGLTGPYSSVMLHRLGNELRHDFGEEIIVWLTLQGYSLKGQKNIAFDGLRLKGEMTSLQESSNVFLIWIDAPDAKRLERVIGRNRPGDPTTIDELLISDMESSPDADRLKQLCPYQINNAGDNLSQLRKETDNLMRQLSINKSQMTIIR